MKKRSIVAKFGGTSLADACQFQKIKAIIEEDPDRRVIVASAPGKRFESDVKVTDLLLECYETAVSGGDPEQKLLEVRDRFGEIIDHLNLQFPLEEEISLIRKHLSGEPEKDYVVSRGEYLNGIVLANYLGCNGEISCKVFIQCSRIIHF